MLFYHSFWVFLWPILFFPISSDAQDKLRVGLSSVSATSGSIWVAEEKGLFKKHGIDAEVIIIGGGASRVVSSLIAGEIQFSVGGGDSVIRSSLRGADTVLTASPLKTGLQRLMVRPDIKTPAELKGKKVAITRFGSASHWVLQLFLRKWGMRIRRHPNRSTWLLAGDVREPGKRGQSMVRFSPFRLSLWPRIVATECSPTPSIWIFTIFRIPSIRQKPFSAKKHDQAIRFVKGICEGIAYFRKNKKESLAVMQKNFGFNQRKRKTSSILKLHTIS